MDDFTLTTFDRKYLARSRYEVLHPAIDIGRGIMFCAKVLFCIEVIRLGFITGIITERTLPLFAFVWIAFISFKVNETKPRRADWFRLS